MQKSTRPLTQPMLTALINAVRGEDGSLILGCQVRTGTVVALIDRELVTAGKVHALTGAGLQIRHKALPPGADLDEPQATQSAEEMDEPSGTAQTTAERDTDGSEELKLAGLRAMGSEKLQETLRVAEQDGDLPSLSLIRRVINERLEAPAQEQPADRYFTHGCGRDVLKRDAALVGGLRPEDNTELDKPLPRRVPAKALTEELTGEPIPVGVARPGYRPSVLLRPVNGEVVERASRETFVAVGAEWGRLEGKRVRIACMDGDVFHQRPLMLLEAGATELSWGKAGDKTVDMPRALLLGSTVLVDGCRVYQVGGPYHRNGDTPKLRIVR